MRSSNKVWVIEADPKPRRTATPSRVATKGTAASAAFGAGATDSAPAKPSATPKRSVEIRSPLQRLASVYIFGSLGPYLVSHPSRNPIWATCSAVAIVLWVLHLGQWTTISRWLASGQLPFSWWFVTMLLVSLSGIVAGSWAILRAGRSLPAQYPRWLRHPKAVGAVGFVFPGSGLFCTGHPGRAALAFGNGAATLLATAIVLGWSGLWNLNLQADSRGLQAAGFELVFVTCLAVMLLGSFLWAYSAFDAARQASPVHSRLNPLGPWWVLPSLVVWGFMMWHFDPSARASDLDRLAASLGQRGYVFIPEQIERVALRLDPSNVVYLVHAAEFAEQRGHLDRADAVRARAEQHWEIATQVMDITSHGVPTRDLAAMPTAPQPVVEDTSPPRFDTPLPLIAFVPIVANPPGVDSSATAMQP